MKFLLQLSKKNPANLLEFHVRLMLNEIANQNPMFSTVLDLHDFKRVFDSRIKEMPTNNHLKPECLFKADIEKHDLNIYKITSYGDKKFKLANITLIRET